MTTHRTFTSAMMLPALLTACAPRAAQSPAPAGESEADLAARARGIHERVMRLQADS